MYISCMHNKHTCIHVPCHGYRNTLPCVQTHTHAHTHTHTLSHTHARTHTFLHPGIHSIYRHRQTDTHMYHLQYTHTRYIHAHVSPGCWTWSSGIHPAQTCVYVCVPMCPGLSANISARVCPLLRLFDSLSCVYLEILDISNIHAYACSIHVKKYTVLYARKLVCHLFGVCMHMYVSVSEAVETILQKYTLSLYLYVCACVYPYAYVWSTGSHPECIYRYITFVCGLCAFFASCHIRTRAPRELYMYTHAYAHMHVYDVHTCYVCMFIYA
jgi:hypothetical protein